VTYISESLRRLVQERAGYCCEYCQISADVSFYAHEVDHVIALKHGGETTAENLAYACWRCNRYKGSDLGSFDPQTNEFSFLYNPRTQQWREHFSLRDNEIIGLTPAGRTTVQLLGFNGVERRAERRRAEDSQTPPA